MRKPRLRVVTWHPVTSPRVGVIPVSHRTVPQPEAREAVSHYGPFALSSPDWTRGVQAVSMENKNPKRHLPVSDRKITLGWWKEGALPLQDVSCKH